MEKILNRLSHSMYRKICFGILPQHFAHDRDKNNFYILSIRPRSSVKTQANELLFINSLTVKVYKKHSLLKSSNSGLQKGMQTCTIINQRLLNELLFLFLYARRNISVNAETGIPP